MAQPTSEFWPILHRLSVEVEKEGQTAAVQAAALLAQLRAMPLGVVNAHITNLEVVSAALTELLNRAKTE